MNINKTSSGEMNNYTPAKTTVRIAPPAPESGGYIKNPFKFVIEFLFLVLALLPVIIWSWIEKFLLSQRKSVKGKVVLITGSGRGLGQGLASQFARLGCKVACVDVDEDLNKETVNEINQSYPNTAKGYKCNVADSEEVKALKKAVISDFGEVNILINNAGLITGASFTDFDDKLMNGVIGVNLISHFIMIREFLPEMIQRNEGHIVATGSICSLVSGSNYSFYCATKRGVLGLMESLHYELNENPNNNIKTTTICPYFVNTSALYMDSWDLWLGAYSVEYVVERAVDGILRNRRLFAIPSFYYFLLTIEQLLPDTLKDIAHRIFYAKVKLVPRSIQLKTAPYQEMYK